MTSPARHEAEHLAELLRREQHAMADFLLALAAFDRARRWAELGHAGLWAFLHHDLGLSAGAAHWRKVAAGLVGAFPAVEAALRDGRLCLSSVVELAKVLTPENQAVVLPRFHRLSAREAKEVAAELAPAAAVPLREVTTSPASARSAADAVRTSEVGVTHPDGDGEQGSTETPGDRQGRVAGGPQDGSIPRPELKPQGGPPDDAASDRQKTLKPAPAAAPAVPAAAAARAAAGALGDDVTPLTADLRRLHLTVSRCFLEKLAAARALRSHAQPGASAGAVLEAALDLLLAREAKRRTAAASRPATKPRPCAPGRIAAAVRREVWSRDEGRCQWPLERGGVCGSTWRLELDHVRPRAAGGPSTPANLRLLCGPHNAEAARRTWGKEFMDRAVATARGRRGGKANGGQRGARKGSAGADGPTEVAR